MTNERRQKLETVIRHRQPGLGIVLENVFDPHNISAVMRSCDAVGIQDVYILNTRIPRHKKWGAKSSSSAAKWLSVHQFEDAAACFAVLKSRYDKIMTTHLSSDAVGLYDLDLTQNIALVFGNEHDGVSEEIRALADGNFIIPQVGIIQSLNISVACAVSIYEAYRQRSIAGLYKEEGNSAYHEQLRQQWGIEM
ncbi:RNA methyltransferase [Niabella ginsenosidivorans]|uniref:tRNA (guanosine(18)-2'-O)-methyltransferase n=1 Tax=Niabella ginsenosidivorans TaxID=1176587 RepID=A0A1A9HZB9_9BACT|nr:RNA methyltransferase [Niabella ginsenosidivorans]ANH80748.1 RNA methyltransferase [Niabella ginsenosidivorans]